MLIFWCFFLRFFVVFLYIVCFFLVILHVLQVCFFGLQISGDVFPFGAFVFFFGFVILFGAMQSTFERGLCVIGFSRKSCLMRCYLEFKVRNQFVGYFMWFPLRCLKNTSWGHVSCHVHGVKSSATLGSSTESSRAPRHVLPIRWWLKAVGHQSCRPGRTLWVSSSELSGIPEVLGLKNMCDPAVWCDFSSYPYGFFKNSLLPESLKSTTF